MLKKIGTVVIIIVIAAMAASCGANKNTNTNTSKDTTSTTSTETKEKKVDTKITYENFSSITMGQSYNDVVTILGEGKETTSSSVGNTKTTSYQWTNPIKGTITVMVQDGVVVSKAQALLKSEDAKMTMDLYNKVDNGMTVDQVKAILGEGQLISQSKFGSVSAEIYAYVNKDGSNANFTFSNGAMGAKSQLNLK